MKTKQKRQSLKRISAIALSLVMAVSFMPVLGGAAFAKEKPAKENAFSIEPADDASAKAAALTQESIDEIAAEAGMTSEEAAKEAEAQGFKIISGDIDAEMTEEDPVEAIQGSKKGGGSTKLKDAAAAFIPDKANWPVCPEYEGTSFSWMDEEYDEELERLVDVPRQVTASISVSLDDRTGIATVTGTLTGNDTFDDLYVDDYYEAGLSGATFTKEVNMKDKGVGYHTIYATLSNSSGHVCCPQAVPTYIYGKAENKLSNYITGKNYFTFSAGSSYNYDSECDYYLEYKKGSGSWSGPQGPISPWSTVKKDKLSAGKNNSTRTYYGKLIEYGGNNYFFSGKDLGKVSKAKKFKTAKGTKPPVKSVTINKAKQSSYSYWIYFNYSGYARKVTVWYTACTITVKMKKKPGTTGIYIGNVKMKGNKKTYKKRVTLSGKQKGKKVKVCVYSYQSTVYHGYSPTYHKKVKVR